MPPVFRHLLAVALLATSTLHAQTLDYEHQDSWKAVHDSAQSPIDIPTHEARAGDALEPQDIRLNHARAKLEVVDNGHAVEVEAKGPEAMIRGRHFKLMQFHFHAESEHTLNGKHFPLEGHFVFRAADGRLAVVGVMYREGAANPLAAKVLGALGKRLSGVQGLLRDLVGQQVSGGYLGELFRLHDLPWCTRRAKPSMLTLAVTL